MSVKSEAQSTHSKNQKTVEILEPGVSLVKPQRRYRRSVAILTRVFVAVVFLGICIFAVYYSINKSEQQQQKEADSSHKEIPETNFNIYHNQVSRNGRLTIERNSTSGKREFLKYNVLWLQDDKHRRLLFNVSDPTTNNYFNYYVFVNHTLYVTPKGCIYYPIGYDKFILQFGVVRLVQSGYELVKMNDEFYNISAFSGTPTNNLDNRQLTLPGYSEDGQPRLAFAYSFQKKGRTCGWQVYFDSSDNVQDINHTEWIEYWFTDMEDEEPDAEEFVDYTGNCVEQIKPRTTTSSH